MFQLKKINLNILLIVISIIASLFYAESNISKFDRNISIGTDNANYHLMIKNDVYRYFSHGYEIKEEIQEGKNYFETGRQNFTKYLYPLVADERRW